MSKRAAVFIRTAAWDMNIFIWMCPARTLVFFLEGSWFDWWHHSDIFTVSFVPDLAVEGHRKHQTKNLENRGISGITCQFWKSQDTTEYNNTMGIFCLQMSWIYMQAKCATQKIFFLMWLLQNRDILMKSVYTTGKAAEPWRSFICL